MDHIEAMTGLPSLISGAFRFADDGVYLNVGADEAFYMSCAPRVTYMPLKTTQTSACFLAQYTSGYREVMAIKWCHMDRFMPDRSFVASDQVKHLVRVLKYLDSRTFTLGEVTIEVIFREFIDSTTAAECWQDLSDI
jgi:hypothetical protein